MLTKILYLLCVCLLSKLASGQVPVENGYIANNYINKFEGTWVWHSGTDTVKIKLKKMAVQFTRPQNSFSEDLVGCHIYIQNGIVVESTMDKYDSLVNNNKQNLRSVYVYNTVYMDTSKVEGSLKDISKTKWNDIFLEYLPGSPTRIRMLIENKEGVKVSLPGSPYISGITLPADIILTKQ